MLYIPVDVCPFIVYLVCFYAAICKINDDDDDDADDDNDANKLWNSVYKITNNEATCHSVSIGGVSECRVGGGECVGKGTVDAGEGS